MKRTPELVFLTGAGSGIGRATALLFAKRGAHVIVTDLNPETSQATADLVCEAGGRASSYQLDVADAVAFETLAELVVAEHGVPDVVVNNAGMVIGGSFLEHSVEDWERTLSIHLMGVVHGSRLFGAHMAKRGTGGHIVNLSSVGGLVPFQLGPAYCTAKAGIRMLSECLSIELASHDIGVTAICPGLIDTNIAKSGDLLNFDEGTTDLFQDLAAFGMARIAGSPEQVARAIERSVRHNRTITPVRPEAWAGYALMRISPTLVHAGMRWVSRENALKLAPAAAGAMRTASRLPLVRNLR